MEIDVPDVSRGFTWDRGFEITVRVDNGIVHIKANKSGLVSLARHLLSLAQEGVSVGNHFHLDDLNSLENGSSELVVERA